MDLTGVLLGSDLRRRWRSWLAVVVLAGVVGGLAMGAVAGWRRTSSAMDRFLEHHIAPNAYAEGALARHDLLAIPGVETADSGDYFLLVPVDREGVPHPEHLGFVSPFSHTEPDRGHTVERPMLIEGRLSDPEVETEAMVDEEMADLYDLRAGDTLTVRGYGPDQVDQLSDGLGSLEPTGTELDLLVTGIQRTPQDVVPKQTVPDVVYLGSAEIHLGSAFDAAHRRQDLLSLGALFGDLGPVGAEGYELLVDYDVTSREALTDAIAELDPEAQIDFSGSDAARARDEARQTIQMQAGLLLAFGGLVAAGGLVLVVQAIRRQLEADRTVQRSLWALGMTGRRAVGLAATKAGFIGVACAAVALGFAVALSPLMPVGHARRAEIDRGVSLDGPVLAIGAALVVLVVALVGVTVSMREAAAIRRGRAARVPQVAVADRAARAGFSPPIVAGIRAALLSNGRGAVLLTVLVASAGIVGALGFAASEDRLASTPDQWGWDFDVVAGDGNDPAFDEHIEASLAENPMVEAYAKRHEMSSAGLAHGDRVDEGDLSAIEEIEGPFEPRMLAGEAPRHEDDIALGASTARRLEVGVGDTIDVEHDLGPVPMEVSGIVVMNLGLGSDRIGEGALVDDSALPLLVDPEEAEAPFVLVRYAPGVDEAAAYEMLHEEWGNTVLRATRAIDVEQLHHVRFLPVWFAGVLALVAAATLAFVLVLAVRRRRHDLALLRTLGFDRRHVRTTVLTQALTLVVPGTLLGIVIGLAAGRVAWSLTTESLGAPTIQVTPIAAGVLVLGGALLIGWLASAIPGRQAARRQPAQVLRTE